MDLVLIEKLFALLDASTAEELEVTENGVTIRMAKHHARKAAAVGLETAVNGPSRQTELPVTLPAPAVARNVDVKAGMTGTFYRSASPEQPPFVTVGAQVQDGDRLALLEAMKTFNPVEAECNGTITEIVAADGSLVEAGTVLFRMERA